MSDDGKEDISLRHLLSEILNTKQELKNCITASETRLILEIQNLKNRVNKLEKENQHLREQLELGKRNQNKNNIVIFGLKKQKSEITTTSVCKEISRLLEVELEESEINDLYPLGRADNCPIKVELISYQKKKLIFRNTKKLKGTGVSISNDLTLEQREELRTLNKFLKKARVESQEQSYIRGNRLVIGSKIYSIEDLENTNEESKPNSAPNTPMKDIEHSSAEEDSVFDEEQASSSSAKTQAKSEKPSTPHLATHKKIFPSRSKLLRESVPEVRKLRSRTLHEN